MGTKRSAINIDPDYEDVTEHHNKRQRLLEEDAKESTRKKIEKIICDQFMIEEMQKEREVDIIDQKLNQARQMMDRLRACIVANFYSSTGQQKMFQVKPGVQQQIAIHPTVKEHLGKKPKFTDSTMSDKNAEDMIWKNKFTTSVKLESRCNVEVKKEPIEEAPENSNSILPDQSTSRTSRYIPVDKREENDQSTHKWMVYVRGSKEEPKIDHFVKKVWFFLHPSYRPNDLVEVSQPPFHLTRRGWGEFPVRIQLHFYDQRNKRVDIIHPLKPQNVVTPVLKAGGLVGENLVKQTSSVGQSQNASFASMVTPTGIITVNKVTDGSGLSAFTQSSSNVQVVLGEQFEPVTSSREPEKKIFVWKKKKCYETAPVPSKEIPPIRVIDFPDVMSLVRAAVKRHPVWQRASTVKRFIKQQIGGLDSFKGTQLWSTKQIMTWCRLHAYSPHYLEKTLHPTPLELSADSNTMGKKFSSSTDSTSVLLQLHDVQCSSRSEDNSDDEIDIIGIEPPKVKIKEEPSEIKVCDNPTTLPPSDEAIFIQDTALKIGVKFEPSEVVPEVFTSTSEDLIFTVSYIKYPDGIGVGDVYKALLSSSKFEFLTNRHLGVKDVGTDTITR
ncbi:hypothetical protein KUTeg_015008 [Tegillarca granosa]|uniref:YEATS domain-containing protein n=1 Tax=Tegillarca granosa TaxID=220873 RepID=A0ABQ9ENY2_TEGGR|nr:hypothetical protein KUTeg_015008 [Tegillarca granosa]